jgi:lauroyl/myristoyl acyltransferase
LTTAPVKTALIKALRYVARWWPRFGFSLARLLAALSRPLGRGIPEERLAEAYPQLSRAALVAARRETWRNFLQNEALDAALARPGRRPRYPRARLDPAFTQLRPPAVLVSFHIGPYRAVGAALEQLDGDVLVLHRGVFGTLPGLTFMRIGDDEWARARALNQAVAALRAGGFVYLAMDGLGEEGYDAATVDAPLLGGSVQLARGGLALARMTGTPVVPVLARWRGSRTEIVSGDPVQPPPGERAMAASLTGWLERHLLQAPGEITARTLTIFRPPAR